MANYIRRIISGNKTRFRDDDLGVELDLAYITDRVIVMGYPCPSVSRKGTSNTGSGGGIGRSAGGKYNSNGESGNGGEDSDIAFGVPARMYRNSLAHTRTFLEHRHPGGAYRVFNLCPRYEEKKLIGGGNGGEGGYAGDEFGGRVSRYPFPDHNVPPLPLIPLFVREARAWLDAAPDHVIALHCKAGKGRSGTLVCAFLLSLDVLPEPPQLRRSLTAKEWAKRETARAGEVTKEVEAAAANRSETSAAVYTGAGGNPKELVDEFDSQCALHAESSESQFAPSGSSVSTDTTTRTNTKPIGGYGASSTEMNPSLDSVLALHSARRMRKRNSATKAGNIFRLLRKHDKSNPIHKETSGQPHRGVSIPSQRRWLYYWSLLLARTAPSRCGAFWETFNSGATSTLQTCEDRMLDLSASFTALSSRHYVRLHKIRVRMRELGSIKAGAVRFANMLLNTTGLVGSEFPEGRGKKGMIWAQLAKYDDEMVRRLETWERYTRAEDGDMTQRRRYRNAEGKEEDVMHMNGESVNDLFRDGRWDTHKMVQQFAWLRLDEEHRVRNEEENEMDEIITYVLRPIMEDGLHPKGAMPDGSIVIDSTRELRVKLFHGHIRIGSFWFIPAYHMPFPQPPFSSQSSLHPTFPTEEQEKEYRSLGLEGGTKTVKVDAGKSAGNSFEESRNLLERTESLLSMSPRQQPAIANVTFAAHEMDFVSITGTELVDVQVILSWVSP